MRPAPFSAPLFFSDKSNQCTINFTFGLHQATYLLEYGFKMNKKRLYKRLKNGKEAETCYEILNDTFYTIRVMLTNDEFQLHTYIFDGNDVFDESNYIDEKIRMFVDFEDFVETLEKEFPDVRFEF